MLLIHDWMTPDPVSVSPETAVYEAMKMMQMGGFRQLPVVVQGRLVGIVTDRDIRSALPSPFIPFEDDEHRQTIEALAVDKVMSRKVITVTEEEPIELAALLMESYKIGALPVVNHEDQVVGIITETDTLHALVEIFDLFQSSVLKEYLPRLKDPSEGSAS